MIDLQPLTKTYFSEEYIVLEIWKKKHAVNLECRKWVSGVPIHIQITFIETNLSFIFNTYSYSLLVLDMGIILLLLLFLPWAEYVLLLVLLLVHHMASRWKAATSKIKIAQAKLGGGVVGGGSYSPQQGQKPGQYNWCIIFDLMPIRNK